MATWNQCGARTGRSLWSSNTITTHHARHRNAPGYSTHYQGRAGEFEFDLGQERLLSAGKRYFAEKK